MRATIDYLANLVQVLEIANQELLQFAPPSFGGAKVVPFQKRD